MVAKSGLKAKQGGLRGKQAPIKPPRPAKMMKGVGKGGAINH